MEASIASPAGETAGFSNLPDHSGSGALTLNIYDRPTRFESMPFGELIKVHEALSVIADDRGDLLDPEQLAAFDFLKRQRHFSGRNKPAEWIGRNAGEKLSWKLNRPSATGGVPKVHGQHKEFVPPAFAKTSEQVTALQNKGKRVIHAAVARTAKAKKGVAPAPGGRGGANNKPGPYRPGVHSNRYSGFTGGAKKDYE